jgi:hypothetical protein
MTSPDRNYDDALRRAFHAMADPVEPVGDGLVRIRAQIDGPWLRRQSKLLFNDCVDLVVLLYVRSQPFFSRLRESAVSALGVTWFVLMACCGRVGRGIRNIPASLHRGYWALRDRFASLNFRGSGWSFVPEAGKPATRHQQPAAHQAPQRPHRTGSGVTATITWLRPALAVTAVLVVVAAGALSVPKFRDTLMNPTGDNSNVTASQQGSGPNGGGPGIGGAGPVPGATSSSSPHQQGSQEAGKKAHSGGGSTSASPGNTQCPSPGPSPSASPSPSVTPTPTPTPTPTGSPTTSPSPTPTGSPNPAEQDTPTPSPSDGSASPSDSSGSATARLESRVTTASNCTNPGAAPSPTPAPTGSASPPSASGNSATAVTQSMGRQRLTPVRRDA